MGRILVRLLVLAIVAAAIAYGIYRGTRQRELLSEGGLVLYGNAEIRQVELAFQATGRVQSVLVEEGDRVTSGQLLATLESDRLREARDRAEALVRQQEQVVARFEAGSRPEEIRQAEAEVDVAEAQAQNAHRNLDRLLNLKEGDVSTQEQVDNARSVVDAADARLRAARENLALLIQGPRIEDIAAARAQLEAHRAERQLREIELGDASLYAPSPAVVEKRILEPGDMATLQKTAITLALTDPLWIRVYVDEPHLGKIHPGMEAEVMTDSYPDKRYKGWVGFISPTAEFTPKTIQTREVRTTLVYEVRVIVPNPENELRLGMPATVHIPIPGSESAAKLPGRKGSGS